jgi:putative phosphoesterase
MTVVTDVQRLVLMADTHLPKRAKRLPDVLWAAVDAADVVVHAGDWVEPPLQLVEERRSGRLIAVYGNNDGAQLRSRLPEVARETVAGLRLGVVHETGPSAGREARCQAAYGDDLDVLVFGHSHIPWDTTTPSGLRLLNPGSPTDRRRQPHCTYLTLTVRDAQVEDLVLHRLPQRS